MKNYINLFLSAIKPLTFFLPCSAIILGSGFAAFNGAVDGGLFSSLLILSLLAQITLNLANDYQRAFLTFVPKASSPEVKQKQMQVRMCMLKLMLGCYIVCTLSLLLLTSATVTGSKTAYALVALFSLALLAIMRFKTRHSGAPEDKVSIYSLVLQFSIAGMLPVLLSYYLHTAVFTADVLLLSGCFATSMLIPYLSENISRIIQQHEPVQSDSMPKILSSALLLQKVFITLLILTIIVLIAIGYLPILVCFSFLATPSLFATCMTLQHFPELDTAQSQKNKVIISCFAFWVLFVIGLMMR